VAAHGGFVEKENDRRAHTFLLRGVPEHRPAGTDQLILALAVRSEGVAARVHRPPVDLHGKFDLLDGEIDPALSSVRRNGHPASPPRVGPVGETAS